MRRFSRLAAVVISAVMLFTTTSVATVRKENVKLTTNVQEFVEMCR